MYSNKSLAYICTLFGKTRQAFYDEKSRKKELQLQEVLILSEVKKIRDDHNFMGCEKILPKIKTFLEDHKIKIGRDKMYKLLKSHDMLIRKRKTKPFTTNSNHAYKRYKNLVANITLTEPCQLWASDITYISTKVGFCYLSLITDCYSHKIVGYCLYPTLESEGALNALQMAFETNKEHPDLIHHSDRGIQYCCNEYVKALEAEKVKISMTQNGDPYENAIAERVNGILKSEYGLGTVLEDYVNANEKTKRAIELYNNDRPHLSCEMLTPNEAHKRTGELKKLWKKYPYKKKNVEN